MQAAVKQSLCLCSFLPWFWFSGSNLSPGLHLTPLCSQSPKRKFVQKFKKVAKGIDKIIIRFIIELWGKMGIIGGKWNDM
jgi:hypothetical protein